MKNVNYTFCTEFKNLASSKFHYDYISVVSLIKLNMIVLLLKASHKQQCSVISFNGQKGLAQIVFTHDMHPQSLMHSAI